MRNGSKYCNTYAFILKMHEGKVVNGVEFFDSIAFNNVWQCACLGSL